MGLRIKLLDRYVASRKGWEIDSTTGLLVPRNVKAEDLEPEFTKSADFAFDAKKFDPTKRVDIAGVANAKETDRMREVLNPAGLDAAPFKKNAVLLLQHNHDRPIGQVESLTPGDKGVDFEAWVGDPSTGAPLTQHQQDARSLIVQRVYRAVSVGFIPHKIRMPAYDDEGRLVEPATIEEWEMLELSVVAVPCNAGALFKPKGHDAEGKDTKPLKLWSFPSLGADGKFIVKTPEEKQMDPLLKELLEKQLVSLNGLAVAMNTLTEGQKALAATVASKGKKKPKKDPPAGEDEEEEEEKEDCDDDEMKAAKAADAAQKALDDRFKAVEESVKGMQDNVSKLVDTVALLVKRVEGEVAA